MTEAPTWVLVLAAIISVILFTLKVAHMAQPEIFDPQDLPQDLERDQ